ncbi:hypothetical protein BOTBODRAFT_542535 [Botryobasidium botryosum FD-172 SS1]|uniref:Secreted protein n=1 Tax=Botryobasidium botryosum (strain FD-172 SS1) TaxID=930990 RepID=A0A067MT71_BOTB1|nr:hypothetical protein BOTBODRAFT_542535 [Botryobasidium botryosum FD-172 SS1]
MPPIYTGAGLLWPFISSARLCQTWPSSRCCWTLAQIPTATACTSCYDMGTHSGSDEVVDSTRGRRQQGGQVRPWMDTVALPVHQKRRRPPCPFTDLWHSRGLGS